MNQLVTQQMSTDLASSVGETTEVSWTAPADLTLEQYRQIGRTFQQIKRSLAWWLGDWMNEGERRFEDAYLQAIEDSGKALETLIKWKAVADRLPRHIRVAELSWTHHFYVAYVEIEQRAPLLNLALNAGLSSRELKEVTKLPLNLRDDVMSAAEEGMEHDELMALVNRLKLGAIGKPTRPLLDDDDEDEEKEEKEEEIPFSDLDGDEDDDSTMEVEDSGREGLSCEDLFDYWENSGVPLTFCGQSEAIWQGLAVRAAMDGEGRMILVWEELP